MTNVLVLRNQIPRNDCLKYVDVRVTADLFLQCSAKTSESFLGITYGEFLKYVHHQFTLENCPQYLQEAFDVAYADELMEVLWNALDVLIQDEYIACFGGTLREGDRIDEFCKMRARPSLRRNFPQHD